MRYAKGMTRTIRNIWTAAKTTGNLALRIANTMLYAVFILQLNQRNL